MDNNVDKCSAVKCTAPPPAHLTKSNEEDFFLYTSFCIGVFIRIGREIRCLPYAGFLKLYSEVHCILKKCGVIQWI